MADKIEKSGNEIIPQVCPDISNRISLNSRAKLFVERYILDNNGTKACEGLYKNPYNAAKRLLSNPTIRTYIEQRIDEMARQIQLTKPQFISKLHRLEDELRQANRKSDLVKLVTLEASVLGLTKDTGVEQQINVFANLDEALKIFEKKGQAIDVPVGANAT